MSALTVKNLAKTFTSGFWPFTQQKTYTAVNGISFEVGAGEIVGFLGPNGAGKTTTIQMLLGTLSPSAGSISYFGKNFEQHRVESLKRVGYCSGYERFPARLTITENLDIVGRVYGLSESERVHRIEELLRRFDMWGKRDNQVGELSAGQTTRVMLAKAFLAQPEIVLLDEPTASLDPDVAHEVRKFIREQRERSKTSFLITSHNMDEVAELCDRVLVLRNGSIIANSSPDELSRSVSNVTVHLTFGADLQRALEYFDARNVSYLVGQNAVSIKLDEHQIAQFLAQIGTAGIVYTHVSIDKPTLEDYFLTVVKGNVQ